MGCFLPWEKTTFVGPNTHKFNRYQSEYPKASHPDIIKTLKNPTKTLLLSPISKQVPVLEEVSSSSRQKNFRVSVHYRLPTIPLIVPCSKEMHKYAKITCLSVIPTGIKLFQTDIINNYAVSCNGLQRSMSRSTTPRFIYLPLFKLQREREREKERERERERERAKSRQRKPYYTLAASE